MSDRDKELVESTCIECGSKYNLTYGRFRKIKDGNFRCKTCMKKWRDNKTSETYHNKSEEEKKRMSDLRKEIWKNKSEEEKQKQISSVIHVMKNLTDEQKKEYVERINKGFQEWRKSLSEEEKLERNKNISNQMKKRWENTSEEDKEKHIKLLHDGNRRWWNSLTEIEQLEHMLLVSKGRDEWYESLSQEDKDENNKKLLNGYLKWYDNLSDEDKNKMSIQSSINSLNYWNSIDNDKKEYHMNALQKGYSEWWSSLSNEDKENHLDKRYNTLNSTYNKTGSELEFTNILNINNIKYEEQYRSKIIDSKFYEKYPINKITNSFVSSKHSWDFLIKTKNKEILVDIDGSIHSKDYNGIATYPNGVKFSLNEYMKDFDSQRIYKTDGLDAYIIKAYKNVLYDKDVVVENIKTKETMSLKTFINLLNGYNLTQEDLKKIL